jgi:hypothetical protein
MTCPPTTTESLDPLADLDGEDLACAGLRRANDFMDVFADLRRQAHDEWAASLPKSKPRKPPTLADVAKQAGKAGIEIARYEVKPDGTVVAIVGKQGATVNDDEVENWLSKQKGY